MRCWGTTGLVALAVTGLSLGASAKAQEMPGSRFHSAQQRTAEFGPVDYRDYYAAEGAAGETSPSDAAKSAPAETSCGCNDCGCDAEEACNPCGDPWRLQDWLQPCRCEDSPWTYGGWIEGGITGNGHNQRGQNANLPVAFNTQSNGAMANQLWGWVDRASNTGGCGWDWGFRVDYLFGSDARTTQASGDIGYDTEWDTSAIYGSALPQLYAVVSYNNINVKLGHFFTIIGNEVVNATGNFFYSHAYTMVWGEPFTHTGALADYKYSDQITLYGGWVQGWDSGFNNVSNANLFLGGVTWTSCDKNTSAAYALTAGDFGNGAVANDGNIYMQSIVLKHKFDNDWQYIFQSDLATNTNLGTPSTAWYGVNQYLIKELNCCWAVGARFEWFRDEDGVRVPNSNGQGSPGDYWEATFGVNWKPHTNVTVRPEVRYDWHTGGGNPYANSTADEQLTFGVDGILTF